MNEQNTNKLYQAFPLLYRGIHKPISETYMSLGFECTDGWFSLLWDLSTAIEAEAKKEGRAASNWPEATNVQEKYGTLRFGIAGASEAMWKLIELAEEKSGHV